MTFQEIILKLNEFWAKQGCILGQPYGMEVGAGTGNPNTFFRVLGPEPYNIAYVEPSRRPTDGRYGESPNRFQHYFQYQVILKPAPKFNQELFIESLVAIGLDPQKHDIRFVEDNWESTPLGAWGLGWEVWCDGMEVAQYTYFQQMGGTPLEVPTIEITYGLERLAMYIQDVDHYRDLKWNDTTTYADLFERHEYWQAKHNFENSSPEALQSLFALYEREVQHQLEQKNFWSAYDYLLKVSHTFNLLDARGMVSVSDRIAKFGMMGKATKAISTLYLEEREALGYPLLQRMAKMNYKPRLSETVNYKMKGRYQKNIAIVELGFEEIPATYLSEWSNIIAHSWFKEQLKKHGVAYRKAYVYFTPRRIVLKIVQPSKQGRVVQTINGPAAHLAYDKDGNSTQILDGFLKKYHLSQKAVTQKEVSGKLIISAEQEIVKPLAEVLQNIVANIIELAPKTKWMIWEKGIPSFIRPLRWILAFHNEKKIPLSLFSMSTGKTTQLPRYELPAEEKITSAQQYLQFIRKSGIILSQKKRMRRIAKETTHHGIKIGKADSMISKNAFLTESPHASALKLEAKYNELPEELITLILEKNQMYVLSRGTEKELWYHLVANHRRVHKRIAHGNHKVAKARLDDGLFYYHQDSKTPLADFGAGLSKIGFHPRAGTYLEKKERIKLLVEKIYTKLGKQVPPAIKQALTLIKNDKATALGKEFPSLEGIIGRAYALREGVKTDVADLLSEHYLPFEPGGKLPNTEEGVILSLADKLDSLMTLAGVEKLPEGNHDPFEIRKTVYRLLTLLRSANIGFSLDFLTDEVHQFMTKRFQQLLEDDAIPQWIAKGVALSQSRNFAQKQEYALELAKVAVKEEDKTVILDTFKRVKNILSSIDYGKIATETAPLSNMPQEEKGLYNFIVSARGKQIKPNELLTLAHLLENFFKAVMVLDKDELIKARRINLLIELQRQLEKDFSLSFT